MTVLERLRTYVGREPQKALLARAARAIVEQPDIRAVYIQASGGLGKSRLIELLPYILLGDPPLASSPLAKLRIARIVDLYNFESRNPDVIEQQLIEGLKQTDNEWYRLAPEQVQRAFHSYLESAREYRRIREIGNDEDRRIGAENMRQLFIACWKRLSDEFPLVMCFDTVETLFASDAPVEALSTTQLPATGVDLVLDWVQRVLPELRHTLVLFSGRPVANNPLIQLLSDLNMLQEGVQSLERFTQLDEIRQYLSAYNVSIDEATIPYLMTITEGRPLLLTCYAETCRPKEGIPPPLPKPTEVADRAAFEDWLIDMLLNPVRQTMGARRQGTLGYCLYFLVYARRGVTKEQLRTLFERLSLPYDREVIDQLGQLALVKTIGNLLFLHDEIFAMIDASGKPDDLGLRQPTLDYMCDISRERVRTATIDPTQQSNLLTAMFDHLYYDLIRDVRQGYRTYSIYGDRLLRDRIPNSVLVFADVFWSTFKRIKEALAQQQGVTYANIIHDEEVRRLKWLRIRDRNTEALELAAQLATRFAHQGTLADDLYLFVDFSLAYANALIQAHPSEYELKAEQLLLGAITLLQQPERLHDELLRLRRFYFLGSAYVALGYLRNQQQAYQEAIAEEDHARSAFKRFRDEKLPGHDYSAQVLLNDHIDPDLAQVSNNLAYNLARSGNFKRGLRLSNELIGEYITTASDYRRALFYNTNAIIHMWRNEYLEAIAPLKQAEQAANLSGISRARGLVAHAQGLLNREMMRARGEPLAEIGHFFEEAVQNLAGEPNSLRDVYHDWSRFSRDLAQLYRKTKQEDKAIAAEQEALAYLQKAFDQLAPGPSMQRADLLESKAVIHRHMGQFDQAMVALDSAEQMMHLIMPDYGQIVSAKIALQRAFMLLDSNGDVQQSLRLMAIALTRAYMFGKQHRDQGTFEKLLEERINQIDERELRTFYVATQTEQFQVHVTDLPYQRPEPLRWEREWSFTIRFFNEIIEALLEI